MRLQDIIETTLKGQVQGVLLRSGGWVGDRSAIVLVCLQPNSDVLRIEEWRCYIDDESTRQVALNRTVYVEPETVLGITIRPSPISLPEGFRFHDEE